MDGDTPEIPQNIKSFIEALVSIGLDQGSATSGTNLLASVAPSLKDCDAEALMAIYEYAFAVMYRCAKDYGVRTFMTVNEPEWAPRFFHLPPELADLKRVPIIRESDHGQTTTNGDRYRRCFGIQFKILAETIRLALDDVQALLGLKLRLSGPTSNQFFSVLADYAAPYLDVCDFHHYSDEANSHQNRIDQAQRIAGKYPGKSIAISEFNLRAGPVPFDRMLFVIDAALEQAAVVMTAIQAGSADNPLDFLALYLFAGPSTHRSFKHLVYGDLNCLSWDGKDTALRSKGAEWYPSFEEQQLRHCTPAYHTMKMLARAVVPTEDASGRRAELLSIPHENKSQHEILLATRNGKHTI